MESNYLEWYVNQPSLIKSLDRDQVLSLIENLYQQQNHKCAISGENLCFEKDNSQAIYLKHNKKAWLPEYELVCWVFRNISFKKDILDDDDEPKQIRRIQYDEEEDDDSYEY